MAEKYERCPECNKIIPYHYHYSAHNGLFCDEKCCEKYEGHQKPEANKKRRTSG